MTRYSIFARLGILAIAILLFGLVPERAKAEDFGPLDGTWEGELRNVDMEGKGRTGPTWQRVVIQDGKATVFYKKKDGQIFEVKPGKFQVQRHLTNALVFAIDSGRDKDGVWVETWAFAITQKDRNTLIANFIRVVNNNDLPLTAEYSKFSVAAAGELQRK